MPPPLLKRGDASLLQCESNVKNKFKWIWLEEQFSFTANGSQQSVKIGSCFEKCEEAGTSWCTLCQCTVKYGSSGKKALKSHMLKPKHIERWIHRQQNQQIVIKKDALVNVSQTAVSFADRVAHSEAMVLGFAADHSLSFSVTPEIVSLARELAKDPQALTHMRLGDRTTCSYKMRLGLAETVQSKTIKALQSGLFSINIDEAFSNNHKKILAVLVNFYCHENKEVVTQHLAAIEMSSVTSATVYSKIEEIFKMNNIPWGNLVSCLMDSCNVMRGSKNGVEEKLRTQAPHLLDIDGDICHHIHNASKKFCEPFELWCEGLFKDLYVDFKYSTDLRDSLSEICEILGVTFTMPERFLSHRWLSCYDVAVSTSHLWDSYKLFYTAFLPKSEQNLYANVKNAIFRKYSVSKHAKDVINGILNTLQQKKMTKDGKDRKNRIIKKVITMEVKTVFVINFYKAVLPLLKKYVLLFQSDKPMIHLVYGELEVLFQDFLGCFVKPEYLVGLDGFKLAEMDLTSKDKFLNLSQLFVGKSNETRMDCLGQSDARVKEFKKNVSNAYLNCAIYLQKKLPLKNQVLLAASAIIPDNRGSHILQNNLKVLTNSLPLCLSDDDSNKLSSEIRQYTVDLSLSGYNKKNRIDVWWATLFGKYPLLFKVVAGILTIFHGPKVESSFKLMGDIIGTKSSRLNTKTVSSIQSVKYYVKSKKKTPMELFQIKDNCNKDLTINFKLASQRRRNENKMALEKKEAKKMKLDTLKRLTNKQEARRKARQHANEERKNHTLKLKKASRKAALEALVQQRKEKCKK